MESKRFIQVHVLFVFLFGLSCHQNNQIKFNKTQWNEEIDPVFPSSYRKQMLNDLTKNHTLIGLKYSELIQLLGRPDFKDSTSLTYKIVVEFGRDIDPIYYKNLSFKFSSDSTIKSFDVKEWKK